MFKEQLFTSKEVPRDRIMEFSCGKETSSTFEHYHCDPKVSKTASSIARLALFNLQNSKYILDLALI